MYKFTIIKTWGQLTIEAGTETELLEKVAFWTELPDLCPMCSSPLYLRFRSPTKGTKSFKYYDVVCFGAPRHSLPFHQYQAPRTGFYIKSSEWARDVRQPDFEAETAPEPEPDPELERAPEPAPEPTDVSDRIARAKRAFEALHIVMPGQKPDETPEQYITRLERLYSLRKKGEPE